MAHIREEYAISFSSCFHISTTTATAMQAIQKNHHRDGTVSNIPHVATSALTGTIGASIPKSDNGR